MPINSIELATPLEILDELILKIKEKQKLLGLSANDMEQRAGLEKRQYSNFLYNKNIHLLSLIKILRALELEGELSSLIEPIVPNDAKEYKQLHKIRDSLRKQQLKKEQTVDNNPKPPQKRISLVKGL